MSLRELRRHVGQLAIAGFDGYQIPPELKSIAREFDLGGLILFARNVESPEQVAETAIAARSMMRELPLWMSVDQEGGRVARLRKPFTEWPPMATLGRSDDDDLAERFAKALASELRAVGITLDFAPVLDIHTNPSNPVIGDRAIGDRAEVVSRLGSIIVRTLQANGVAACGKHFPGHGDTSSDSHHELPLLEHPPDRLRAVEMVPFKAAIEAQVASIMTAHVLIPSLDEHYPATLSRRVVTGILRQELGFGGVIFTDDLQMRAITKRYSVEEAAVHAVAAGCDGILLCGTNIEQHGMVLEGLIRAVESEVISLQQVQDSLKRHRRMKERFLAGREPRSQRTSAALRARIGADEHQAVAAELARFL